MIKRLLIFCAFLMGSLLLLSSLLASDEEDWKARERIIENLQFFGKSCLIDQDCGVAAPVYVAGQPTGTGLSGKGVYDKYCFACHETGVNEAPLVGAETWAPRVEQGMDVLLQHTKEGFNEVMPAMGTCVQCTDAELEAAIEYLITGEDNS